MYFPWKGRRPPRGENSEVPVLEGLSRVDPRGKILWSLDTCRPPGPRSEGGCWVPAASGPDVLAINSSGPGVEAHSSQAIRISAQRGVGLISKGDSTRGALPELPGAAQRIFSGKKENPAPYDPRDVRWRPFGGASEPAAAFRRLDFEPGPGAWPMGRETRPGPRRSFSHGRSSRTRAFPPRVRSGPKVTRRQQSLGARRGARRRGRSRAKRRGQQHNAFDGASSINSRALTATPEPPDLATTKTGHPGWRTLKRRILSAIARAFASRLATLVRSACQRPKPSPQGIIWTSYGGRLFLSKRPHRNSAPV